MTNITPDNRTTKERYDPMGVVPLAEVHDVLGMLLREQGITKWSVFEESSEGKVLPGDVPNLSGELVAQDGRVYSYWFDWDAEKEPPEEYRGKVTGWYTLGESHSWSDEHGDHPFFRKLPPEEYAHVHCGRPLSQTLNYLGAKRQLGLPFSQEEQAYWDSVPLEEKWGNLRTLQKHGGKLTSEERAFLRESGAQ